MWKFIIKQILWLFSITQTSEWTFKIIPSGYWILRDGYFDDNGIWMDSETWKDS